MSTPGGGKIFLTGATGDVGAQVLRRLEDEGADVRVMLRRQAQVDEFKGRGVDAVQCSFETSSAELAGHMGGCETLLLLTAAVPGQLQHSNGAVDAAFAAGVRWVVRISAADARDEGNVPWVKAHAAADRYLMGEAERFGRSWTVMSASAFMQNILSEAPAIRKGFLPQTCGHGRAGWM